MNFRKIVEMPRALRPHMLPHMNDCVIASRTSADVYNTHDPVTDQLFFAEAIFLHSKPAQTFHF